MGNTLGQLIHEKRLNERLTQEGLAELTGVSKWTVINWEADKRVPLATTLLKIAEALNTDVNYLLGVKTNDLMNEVLALPVLSDKDISANQQQTFAFIAKDSSMYRWGIQADARVIISGAETPRDMDIVLVSYKGQFALRKIHFLQNEDIELLSSDGTTVTISAEEASAKSFLIHGKAVWVITEPHHGI